MNSAPFYSIITVTKNNLKGLRKTWGSLAVQSCGDYEWIVMDGGSADGTLDYLQGKTALVESGLDEGLYDAMNKGLARAQGRYVIFMNAGDMFASPDVLDAVWVELSKGVPEPVFVYGDALEEEIDGYRQYKRARSPGGLDWGMFTHHQAMVYGREALSDARYDLRYGVAADYDFTVRFFRRNQGKVIVYWPHAFCIFEAGGLSQQRVQQGRKEQFKIRCMLKTVSLRKNMLIYMTQALAWRFRHHFPVLYWFLKR